MNVRLASVALAALTVVLGTTTASALQQQGPQQRGADEDLVTAFDDVSRGTAWTKAATIPLDFDTFHPQAMEVTEDRIYLSSVEIIEPTTRYPQPVGGYDRTAGKGVGHLFVLDRQGNLLRDIVVGEGDSYHPGGLDLADGYVYLPVAEYRPDSAAVVYRVDTTTFEVEKLFTVDDHVGGVVVDQKTGRLVGQSWGSRRFYDWTLEGKQKGFWLNENHFLDYQDCEYVSNRKALCSGVTGLPARPGTALGYELGGFAMIDLADRHRILHEVPVQLWSTAGHVVTRNPTDLEAEGNHLTLYAAPDDAGEGAGTQILVYEADVTPLS